jgi:hypothetical protein
MDAFEVCDDAPRLFAREDDGDACGALGALDIGDEGQFDAEDFAVEESASDKLRRLARRCRS